MKKPPIIAAVGNFDGVHRGHQQLLARVVALAAAEGADAGAVVFEPHPRRFFQPDAPPFLLTLPKNRAALLKEHGAKEVLTLTFDAALAARTPEEFGADILQRKLGLYGVVVGSEFRFGKGRAGDAPALLRLGRAAGLVVEVVEPEREGDDGEKIGSSAIRAAVANGAMKSAAAMLGRPWSVEGRVAAGQKLGRTLGFPTANMTLGDVIEPRRGVYAVRARAKGRDLAGVANFGRRPTIGDGAPLLETHLFDFSGDLYGDTIEVAFMDFLREERRFDGLDALKAQIAQDCEQARRILGA